MELYLRIIADVEGTVIKEFRIKGHATLSDLHEKIYTSFQLAAGEMGSFYRSNALWEQGDEIPQFAFEDDMPSMEDYTLAAFFQEQRHALYVYDLMNMHAFYVELIRTEEEEGFEDFVVVSEVGEHPFAGQNAAPQVQKPVGEMSQQEIDELYGLDSMEDMDDFEDKEEDDYGDGYNDHYDNSYDY